MNDYDDPGLGLFDDHATVVGGFPNAVLGYDKKEVDDHVRKLEKQLVELRRQAREQTTEHELLKSQASATDLSRLTGHASVLLNAAESHSDELKTKAQIDAQVIRQSARRDGEELRAGGQQEADDLRATAMANLRRLRDKQTEEINGTLAAARKEADQVVSSAARHVEAIMRQANQQAAAIVAAAEAEAARISGEAQAIADRTRTTSAQAASDAHAQAASLLAEATAQHESATKVLAAETEAASKLRLAAGQDAENIRIQAVREAEQHLAATRSAGAQLRARLDAEAERRKDQLVAEIAALANQKKAIQAQLSQIVGIGAQAAVAGDQAQGDWPSALYPADDGLPAKAEQNLSAADEASEPSAAKTAKRKPRTKQSSGTEDPDTQEPGGDPAASADSPDDEAVSTVIRERESQ
jgi:cell division septum initiation protein DivIVA